MLNAIRAWIEQLKRQRRRCREDAQLLLQKNPRTAYYDAQRLVARARFSGDGRAFIHWTRVAAEVARISDNPMDTEIVTAIVDEERRRANK